MGRSTLVATQGNVGIGTTSPGALLHVNSSAGGVVLRLQNTAGTCDHTPGAASETVTCSSDRRLKAGIQDGTLMVSQIAHWKLIKAIQELERANDRQQAEIETLKKELRDLKKK